jgi:hypothetical protein
MNLYFAASMGLVAALSACQISPDAYANRGDPENLLDTSVEVVHVGVGSQMALATLSDMVRRDMPTRAEMECVQDDVLCAQAEHMLTERGIQTRWAQSGGTGVALVYERVMARDCENRFIDNSYNPYNLHHPTFGCSVVSNTLGMVSDKRQFTNPELTGFQDGEKTVQAYEAYLDPPKPVEEKKKPTASLLSGAR